MPWASHGQEFINIQRQIRICISTCLNDAISSSCSQELLTPAMCMTSSVFFDSNMKQTQPIENLGYPLNNITDTYSNMTMNKCKKKKKVNTCGNGWIINKNIEKLFFLSYCYHNITLVLLFFSNSVSQSKQQRLMSCLSSKIQSQLVWCSK